MKLKSYAEFVGDRITSDDNYSRIIISKETTNNGVQFRDDKGSIYIDDRKIKIEEEATMVGTGTLTPSSGPDLNVKTPGHSNTTDSASSGGLVSYY